MLKDLKRISGKSSGDHNLDEGSILCLTVLCMCMDREATRDGMLLNQEGAHILQRFCSSAYKPGFLECL